MQPVGATTWGDARNLLCVRLDGAAGVLAITPALRALGQAAPRRHLTLLASRAGAAVAPRIAGIHDFIAYDAPWASRPVEPAHCACLGMRYLIGLRGFDAAVIFTAPAEDPSPAAALCELAGIPLRLVGPCAMPGPHAGLDAQEPRRQLDLVASIGARCDDERLSYRVSPRASWRARIKLEESGLDPRQAFIAVHAASALGAAAEKLSVLLDTQVVVIGAESERSSGEAVRRAAGDRARSLVGCLSLEERAAILEFACFVLGGDAVTLLLASAVGTPVVGFERPWMVPHRLLPRNAATEEAVQAACDLWLDIHWRAAA